MWHATAAEHQEAQTQMLIQEFAPAQEETAMQEPAIIPQHLSAILEFPAEHLAGQAAQQTQRRIRQHLHQRLLHAQAHQQQ